MTESGPASGKRGPMACSFGSCSDAEQTAERRDPSVRHLDLVISVGSGKTQTHEAPRMRGRIQAPVVFFA